MSRRGVLQPLTPFRGHGFGGHRADRLMHAVLLGCTFTAV